LKKDLIMTITDLKYEIQKAIDSVPESVLVDVLEYLKQLQKTPNDTVHLSQHLGLILREDKELLQRLSL